MADTQTVIAGNLTDDPDVRQTDSGTVANFSVAVTPRIRTEGQWRDAETSYFRCAVWGAQADNAARSLHKGDRVLLTGRLRTLNSARSLGQIRGLSGHAAGADCATW